MEYQLLRPFRCTTAGAPPSHQKDLRTPAAARCRRAGSACIRRALAVSAGAWRSSLVSQENTTPMLRR